jgi:hypothetical protein
VITHLATLLPQGSALFLATDTNPAASKCTRATAQLNNKPIEPVQTDLVECLIERIAGKTDIILFNPPYVPTDDEEFEEVVSTQSGTVAASWAGGAEGRQVTDRVLPLIPVSDQCIYLTYTLSLSLNHEYYFELEMNYSISNGCMVGLNRDFYLQMEHCT